MAYRKRYGAASRQERSRILDEFCELTRYHRKYATAALNHREGARAKATPRRRRPTYSPEAIGVIEEVWRAAGYPWSVRLKALLGLWLPWARRHLHGLTPEVEQQVLRISARQLDRRLAPKKRRLQRRLYGRTKPGKLLRHQVPIRGEPGPLSDPGHTEVDLVSHSGPSARGEFAYSLNLTDLHSGWCASRVVLGRGEEGVLAALCQLRSCLPFPLRGIHSDNGSEFINHHLIRYCRRQGIQFTRSRPYKKDDNARIEQKNWTHVRRIWGWERYDSSQVVRAMNDLYARELGLMMNLFQPSVKLLGRERVGSRLRRHYDPPRTPLDRLANYYANSGPLPQRVQELLALRDRLDPFELSGAIERKLREVEEVRSRTCRLATARTEPASARTASLSPQRGRPREEKTCAAW